MQYSSDIKKSVSPYRITVNNCGELRTNADSDVRRYAGRSDYQLIYVCEGQCVVKLEDGVQIAYPGDCILYRPGEVQDYFLAKKTQPCTYWIHFTGEICEKIFAELALQDVHIIKSGQNREIHHLMSRICRYYNLQTPNYELICSGLLQSILALISNQIYGENGHTVERRRDKIRELISWVKLVPNLYITVGECAQFCGLSKPHFTRVFKQVTGMPPVQFMLQIRIDRAKELLDFTDKSIAEIAEASGFTDQNYFARTFKSLTGMSPTQYRRIGESK